MMNSRKPPNMQAQACFHPNNQNSWSSCLNAGC
jgi:hypothetical protein